MFNLNNLQDQTSNVVHNFNYNVYKIKVYHGSVGHMTLYCI